MSVHRFGGKSERVAAKKDIVWNEPDLTSFSERIIQAINQQGVSESLHSYLDSQLSNIVKNIGLNKIEKEHIFSTLQQLSDNIDRGLKEKSINLENSLHDLKSTTEIFRSHLNTINDNKVDKNYLDEKLKVISDKIKDLQVLDRNYLNTRLKQLSTELFTRVNETHSLSVDKEYLDKTVQALNNIVITKQELEDRLSAMTNTIKTNLMEGIEQFVSKNDLNTLLTTFSETYVLKNDLSSEMQAFIKKDELQATLKSIREEIATSIKNTENDEVTRLQCSATFNDYLTLFIHRIAYQIVRNYAKVSFNMNWIEAKSHNLTEDQVGDLITDKMGLSIYGDVLKP